MGLVVPLEDVLLGDESEDSNRLLQDNIYLLVSFLDPRYEPSRPRGDVGQLTPFKPFFRWSSMKSEMNSGALGFKFMNDSNACQQSISGAQREN